MPFYAVEAENKPAVNLPGTLKSNWRWSIDIL